MPPHLSEEAVWVPRILTDVEEATPWIMSGRRHIASYICYSGMCPLRWWSAMFTLMKMEQCTIICPFHLAVFVSGWLKLFRVLKHWSLIFLEVTMRRQWPMSSTVSPYGPRNTSSFCKGHRLLVPVHLSRKGHQLLFVAVHLRSKGHRFLLVAVHMSSKVHTYLRGTPA